jgi:hypothetical protein
MNAEVATNLHIRNFDNRSHHHNDQLLKLETAQDVQWHGA